MTVLNLKETLQTIRRRQWMLKDIDWDAPGAELVTDEQKPKLRAFMADLMWVEHIGARAFAGMAINAPDPTLREIYSYFHAEEQKHANAELALMKRWDLLGDSEVPLPTLQIAYALDMMDKMADRMPFETLATSIPMLECALDGALLKFLTDEVRDPLLKVVLNKINADESRHLAVGFHVMGELSGAPVRRLLVTSFKMANGWGVIGLKHLIATLPLYGAMREELFEMGLDGSRLSQAMERYRKAGERDPRLHKNPLFRITSAYSRLTMERHPVWSRVEDLMLAISERFPRDRWPTPPSWSDELTYRVAQ
ncbi:ferritin-like domain-containing protein [Mycobacterium bourgelatii]|uniref:Reductase n=1 Tax=Mycobacterium bourgelatii TaxID=1273442 RepID=A0A7I9YNV3_MYCBU|nr:ferritin-like domain-containing protein [Mycobacterium bourgelatii]MCV6975926.1 ferritin-like domain-containing protein [Mycobacterium bourgelatii]GFG90345.1 hypothetical protein MBOU_23870 [Mycobacterium bourgelatii]